MSFARDLTGFDPLIITKEKSPWFFRAVVKQVDLDGGSLDETEEGKQDGWCPINSIKARIHGITSFAEDIICWPLFQNHVMMPIKIDEPVIIMMFPGDDLQPDFYQPCYWICKEPQRKLLDDVNYTNHVLSHIFNRQDSSAAAAGSMADLMNSTIPDEEFGWGGSSEVHKQTLTDIYFKREPIPHFKKRAGDLVLQGSNNTLICLGTDRASSIDDTVEKNEVPEPAEGQKYNQSIDLKSLIKDDGQGNPVAAGAGTIDIVVGRGKADNTKPTILQISGKDIRNSGESTKTEGNFQYSADDFKQEDSAIIKLSMNTKMDTDFKMIDWTAENYSDNAGKFEKLKPIKDDGKSAIIQKADSIRIIGRHSLKIGGGHLHDKAIGPASIVIAENGELFISAENVRIECITGISLGGNLQAEEQAVLGNKLVAYLKKLNSKISMIAGLATGTGPTGPVSGSPSGPPFQPNGELDSDADKLISETVFIGE